jgi:hypothetical protein
VCAWLVGLDSQLMLSNACSIACKKTNARLSFVSKILCLDDYCFLCTI